MEDSNGILCIEFFRSLLGREDRARSTDCRRHAASKGFKWFLASVAALFMTIRGDTARKRVPRYSRETREAR